MFIGRSTNHVPSSSTILPPSGKLNSSKTGRPLESKSIVCLMANTSPGPVTKSQSFPVDFLGLQFVFKKSSSDVENIDPIKTDCGFISIP